MCTSPILIKSNKFLGKTREVPCGSCDECLRKRANDVYVRASMEYEHCRKHGGNGFMCCLTYSDDILPMAEFNGKKFMVFDKKALILFVKRLRMNLDRQFLKEYSRLAPDFKYLITSEFGTDPNCSHRPHYHLLFFFKEKVQRRVFSQAFIESTYCRVFNKQTDKLVRYFGKINQCAEINPKRGGIYYSAKYVCKDLMYAEQDKAIRDTIAFNKEIVNARHGIIEPVDELDELRNKCIRSTKAYKQDIEKYVRPYRHMLQFYMISNDLGASACVEKYGKQLENMPTITIKGFNFTIPRLVKEKYEQIFGYKSRKKLDKTSFLNYLDNVLNEHILQGYVTRPEAHDLLCFAKQYIVPEGGSLRIVETQDFDLFDSTLSPVGNFEDLCNEFLYFEDNDFFLMRDHIQNLIDTYNSEDNLLFRAKIAREKRQEEQKKQMQKKRNKGY